MCYNLLRKRTEKRAIEEKTLMAIRVGAAFGTEWWLLR